MVAQYQPPIPAPDLKTYVNLFFYGDHGSQKTTTACQVGMKHGKVLLYTMDDDWKSLKNHPEILANTDIVHYEDLGQIMAIAAGLKYQLPPYDVYTTFVFDTVGGWIDKFVEQMTKHIKFGKNGRTSLEGLDAEGKKMLKDLQLAAPELTDYNIARIKLRDPVQDLIDAPVNVVFNAHARAVDEKSGEGNERVAINYRYVRPDMPEAAFNIIVRKCDALGQFEKDEKLTSDGKVQESFITFKPSNTVSTKSRIGPINGKTLRVSKAIAEIEQWMEN